MSRFNIFCILYETQSKLIYNFKFLQNVLQQTKAYIYKHAKREGPTQSLKEISPLDENSSHQKL